MSGLSDVENIIGYTFRDKALLKRAFTLSSASEDNNERLEFFGDAVLQFVVSEYLYAGGRDEGAMTERRQRIVSGEALEEASERLGLDRYLIRGKGDTHNHKAVSSVYEAVTAAVYIDGGLEKAKEFVLSTVTLSGESAQTNYKGKLQEFLQGAGKPLPDYKKTGIGTPQSPRFRVRVSVFGKTYSAEGSSVKEAEQLAAKAALKGCKKI